MTRWRLLSNRDFRLLWGGAALSELGSQTSTVAYPLLILALTGSAAKAGVVGLARWLPLALFALPAGMLADRADRKKIMIGSDAIRLVAAASIVIGLWLGRPAYLQIVVVAFLDGALFITSHICERGALGHVVEAADVQDAVAQNEARYFSASIVGPPLGGLLFGVARSLPFIADTISFLASIGAISATRTHFQASARSEQFTLRGLRREATEGFTWLRGQPFFRTVSLLFAAGNPVYIGLYLLAILLAKRHGASSAEVGLMFAIVGAGGLIGATVAAPIRRRFSARAIIAGGDWLLLIAVLILLVAHDALIIGLLIAAAEFSTPIANSVVAGAMVTVTPDHLQGRVQAASTTLAMSVGWLGPLAIGLAFQHSGPTTTILMVAVWALALALLATLAPALKHPPKPTPHLTTDTRPSNDNR